MRSRNSYICINKTVSRNFIMDFVAKMQNFFGLDLTSYEKMVEEGVDKIWEEAGDVKMKWFRYEITQLGESALSITMYGEKDGRN